MRIEARLTDPLDALHERREPGRLRVGLVVPQSGALGLTGPSAVDAALLAAHELNTGGGVRGRYVDLVLVDGGRAPAEVAAETGRLCEAGAVDAVVGFHTSDVHRAVEVVVAGRTPYVFTPPHEGGRRRVGVVCTGVDPGRQLGGPIAWLARHHAARRWALVGNDYIWPQAVHRQARRAVAAAGGRTVLERRVPLGGVAAGMERLLDDLRGARPDALLLSLVGRDLARFNAGLRHAGLDSRPRPALRRTRGERPARGRRRPDRPALRGDAVVRVPARRAAPRPRGPAPRPVRSRSAGAQHLRRGRVRRTPAGRRARGRGRPASRAARARSGPGHRAVRWREPRGSTWPAPTGSGSTWWPDTSIWN